MILTQHDRQQAQALQSKATKRHDTRLSLDERAIAAGIHPQTVKSRVLAIKRKNPEISEEAAIDKAIKRGKAQRMRDWK